MRRIVRDEDMHLRTVAPLYISPCQQASLTERDNIEARLQIRVSLNHFT